MLRPVTVEIRLLGPLEVRATPAAAARKGVDHATAVVTATDFRSKKSMRVLEVLALAGGQTVTKDALVDTLWRQRTPTHPAATVEVAVSLLRSTLDRIGVASAVLTEPGGYRLDPGSVTIDLLAFDHAVVTAERLPDHERLAVLRDALGSVRGALLENEPPLDWLAAHRDRARRRVELARLMLARTALDCAEPELAFQVAEAAWTDAAVVLEDAYALGAQALLAQGRRSQAAALLALVDERLDRERATTAGPSLLAVRQQLERPFELHGSRSPIRLDPSLQVPVWPVPFLGRTGVLDTITQRMGERAWFHLVGGRGLGKSRVLDEVEARGRSTVMTYRVQCAAGDEAVPSLLAARIARVVGRRDTEVDAALFLRVAESFDSIGPTLLLVDDLHRADPASVAVVRALVSAGGATSLTVVSAGGPAPDAATPLTLERLTPDEVAPVAGAAVWRATAGHPLALVTCARATRSGGVVDDGGTRDLREIVGELGPIPAVVVSLASQAAGAVDAADVSALTEIPVDDVRQAMTELVASGVAVEAGTDAIVVESPLFRAVFDR